MLWPSIDHDRPFLEDTMTKFNSMLSLSALTFAGALFAMPLLSSGAQASVTSDLMQCKFNTKQKVVSCCQRILHDRKRPTWMPGGENACGQASVCIGSSRKGRVSAVAVAQAKPRCFIRIVRERENSRPDEPRQQPRPEREQLRDTPTFTPANN
jgi:hypothetical protein